MATDAQIEANRRNAQLSTGPRTPEGKARSAANALKHGLTAQNLLIPSEDPQQFVTFAAALRAELNPQGDLENMLVDRIIGDYWRLQRVEILEAHAFCQRVAELGDTPEHSGHPADAITLSFRYDRYRERAFDSLGRHESRLERSFYRALRELRVHQTGRSRPQPEPQNVNLQNKPNPPTPTDPHEQPQVIDKTDVIKDSDGSA
jgi:hypothetical protein